MAQLPIADFLKARLTEYDSTFDVRPGTAFESLFFKPAQLISQPFADEVYRSFISQSFARILATDVPDDWDEESVDALAANLLVFRRLGAYSSGVVRVYYNDPADFEYPEGGFVASSSTGTLYRNLYPFSITAAEMTLNLEDGLYYYDIIVQSDDATAASVQDPGGIISVAGDTTYIRVTNLDSISGGVDRETNTQLIDRIQKSIGVRDLLTEKGIAAILFQNFPNSLVELTPVGFGEQEMMRDIVYNTHIGGKADVYVKTTGVTEKFANFIGIEVDTTRQSYASKNVTLNGIAWSDLGNPNIDRTTGFNPIVTQIKDSTYAEFISSVDLSSTIDLSSNQYVKIGIDGLVKDVRVAGVIPSATNRNEIINLINYAFGINVAFVYGNTIRIVSPTSGVTSQIILSNPTVGGSALDLIFGLPTGGAPYSYQGDGPLTFLEGIQYEILDDEGQIRRVLGSTIVTTQTTGRTSVGSTHFIDLTTGIFASVTTGDILTISSGADVGDYRVLSVVDDNEIIVDAEMTDTSTSVTYSIARTGIKNGETVYVTYYYNPISIDVGNRVKLDIYGRTRGIRPGREKYTITQMPFLRINSIQEIDPLTLEPTGIILNGMSGFGRGGFGKGGFGRGAGADYHFLVNSPAERFSMYEDSYIVFEPGLAGLSVRVNFDTDVNVSGLHSFCTSDYERIVDGDVLVKHYLPAYVSGTINYKISASLASTAPTNDETTAALKNYISSILSMKSLDYSDIVQFLVRTLDPYDRYETFISPFTLTAEIFNTDGTTFKITGADKLEVPTLDPFPIETDRPMSPKIVHWLADNIVLVRTI